MIPWLRNGRTHCHNCGHEFFYDTALVKRVPRTCLQCKMARVTRNNLARQEKLKTATAEMSGLEIEHLAVRTHKEVGEILGISAEASRKLERSALAKLRPVLIKFNKVVFPQ